LSQLYLSILDLQVVYTNAIKLRQLKINPILYLENLRQSVSSLFLSKVNLLHFTVCAQVHTMILAVANCA